jgi:SAM-dependent methyltransferase
MTHFIKSLYLSSIWCKVVVISSFAIIYYYYNKTPDTREGFAQRKKFIIKQGLDIYDKFYANIYDDIVGHGKKNQYEVDNIIKITKIVKTDLILDIGSGTGNIVSNFSAKGYTAIGLDKSRYMVAKALEKNPGLDFSVGDAVDTLLYTPHTFNLITCLYFTVYDIDDKSRLFQNTYEWLKPGGYFAIHLMVTDTPQKILTGDSKNNSQSRTKFKDFTYKSKFNIDNNVAIFNEDFTDSSGKIRKNMRRLHIPTTDKMVNMITDRGFVLDGKFDLTPINYDNHYIYIFYKPE